MRRGGVGPGRLKRTKRASRREIPSVDQPYSPRACMMSQPPRIVQSRVKLPLVHDSAWRFALSRPRTSRVEVEGVVCSCFIPKLLLAKSVLGVNSFKHRPLQSLVSSVDRVPAQRRCRRCKNPSAACTPQSQTSPHQPGQRQHPARSVSVVFENVPSLW